MALEPLNVKFNSDTTGFSRGLKTVSSGIKQVTSGISGLVKSAARIAGVTLGVKALADSFKAFTKLESNLKRTGDIFGSAAKNIQGFAEGSAKAFGLSESVAYEYASTYGNLFKNITSGVTENSAVTIKMLKASAVIASKTGRTMEDVNSRIRSGLLGSTEAIEDLGINVNISMLEMTDAFKRIANGRSWNQLNFYEQQQIRTLGILEQAHKNFGEEVQGGAAFSLSVLSSAFKDLMATAGSFVNVALKPIIQALTVIVRAATTALKALSALLGINASLSESNADAISAGGTAAGEMADGLDDSAKAAQKLKRQLAGFDKFNDITATATQGLAKPVGGSIGAAGGLGIEMDFEEIKPPDTAWTDKLLSWAKEFKDTVAPLKTALDGLWETLKTIGGFAWQGLQGFYENFLKPVGTWVLGEGLPRLVTALKDGLQAIDWEKINGAFNNLWKALAPFAINVGEGLLWLWENVLLPFGTWTMNEVVPRFLNLLATALDVLNSIMEAAKPALMWLWEEFLKPAGEWVGEKLLEALDWLNEKLKAFGDWVTEHKDQIDEFVRIAGLLALGFIAVKGGITLVTGAFGAFKTILAALTSPAGVLVLIIGLIAAVVTWAGNGEEMIDTLKGAFSGLGKFLNGVFKGDWDMAWAGIKQTFASVINTILIVAESFVNVIIKGLNWLINKINTISFTVPDWVPGIGGKTVGFSIPNVSEWAAPRLAQGGLAYGEVQAIVGDNRNARQDPEVISPLSKLQDMITAAVLQRDIAGGGEGQKIELRLLMEDGTALAAALVDPMNKTAKNLGYGPVFRVGMA